MKKELKYIDEKELKYIDELDYILDFLAKIPHRPESTGYEYIQNIYSMLKSTNNEMTFDRFFQIINKLSKDNYVETKIISGGTNCKISFDGLVQNELGGYKAIYLENNRSKINQIIQDKRITDIQNQQLYLTFILAFGALVASFYYILEIWKYFTQCN